jgi:glycosyltransferase involved in cell wall biosynthesis
VAARPGSILLVTNMYPSERDPVFGSFVQRQVEAMRALGVDVEVVANTDPRSGRLASALKYPRLLARARAAGRRGGFDVVVGHFLYPTAVVARDAARASGAPFVLVAHGTDVRSVASGGRVAEASRRAMDEACLIVAVSEDLAGRVRALGATPPVEVCHMGVDTRRFRLLSTARLDLGLDVVERIALFVGNLVEVKNVTVLLEAFARLRAEESCERLVVVGGGPLRAALEARAAELGVADRVAFTGQVAHEELPRWMSAADVFVLPSRDEGLGLVLLEAMACGTPCVGSAVGGVPELVDDSVGTLVRPGDADALAEGMRIVLERGRGAYEEACRDRAVANEVAAMAGRFLDLIGTAGCVER